MHFWATVTSNGSPWYGTVVLSVTVQTVSAFLYKYMTMMMMMTMKWLDGSTCHLIRRWASAQATLCYMGTLLRHGKGHSSPHFSAHVYCGQTVAHLSYCWTLVFNVIHFWPPGPRRNGKAAFTPRCAVLRCVASRCVALRYGANAALTWTRTLLISERLRSRCTVAIAWLVIAVCGIQCLIVLNRRSTRWRRNDALRSQVHTRRETDSWLGFPIECYISLPRAKPSTKRQIASHKNLKPYTSTNRLIWHTLFSTPVYYMIIYFPW